MREHDHERNRIHFADLAPEASAPIGSGASKACAAVAATYAADMAELRLKNDLLQAQLRELMCMSVSGSLTSGAAAASTACAAATGSGAKCNVER
eukprot:3939416-Pleurochrysis_carterae.AAC.1